MPSPADDARECRRLLLAIDDSPIRPGDDVAWLSARSVRNQPDIRGLPGPRGPVPRRAQGVVELHVLLHEFLLLREPERFDPPRLTVTHCAAFPHAVAYGYLPFRGPSQVGPGLPGIARHLSNRSSVITRAEPGLFRCAIECSRVPNRATGLRCCAAMGSLLQWCARQTDVAAEEDFGLSE